MNTKLKWENAPRRADWNTAHAIVYKIQFNFEVRTRKCNFQRLPRKHSSNREVEKQWRTVSPATGTYGQTRPYMPIFRYKCSDKCATDLEIPWRRQGSLKRYNTVSLETATHCEQVAGIPASYICGVPGLTLGQDTNCPYWWFPSNAERVYVPKIRP